MEIMRERVRRCSVSSCELLSSRHHLQYVPESFGQQRQQQLQQQQQPQSYNQEQATFREDKDPEFRRRRRSGTWP